MADCRGLIIAIEDYPQAAGQLSSPLTGATRAGEQFRDWLLRTKNAAEADITFLASRQATGRSGDATIAGVKQAVRSLTKAAASQGTGQLYIYFSGHGASYARDISDVPDGLLLTQDFQEGAGDCCVKLSELQNLLWTSLGPGEHFYFLDACRTTFGADQITPAGLGITPEPHRLGRPAIYTLYSTARDQASPSDEAFWRGLSDGLDGRGKSKRWNAADMFVTFESLADYLREQRRLPVDADKRGTRHYRQVIRQIAPVPEYRCRLDVAGARPSDEFRMTVLNDRLQPIMTATFRGPTHEFVQKPDDYHVDLSHAHSVVRRIDPPPPAPADLYEDCRVRFQIGETGADISTDALTVRHAEGPPDSPPRLITLKVDGLTGASVQLRNVQTGEVLTHAADLYAQLPPGTYEAALIEEGTIVRSERLVLAPDAEAHYLDIGRRPAAPVRDAIAATLPQWAYTDRTVALSESLGHMASDDLALWLSILGASRIEGPDDFSKLKDLPLMRFDDVPPGGSGVYVLAGLEGPAGLERVSVTPGAEPGWQRPRSVPGMAGMFEAFAPGDPGARVVSFAVRGAGHAISLQTCCLPNRVTLIVVAQPAGGAIEFRQMMLVPSHLREELPFLVRERLGPALQVVRLIAASQRLFGRGESPEPPGADPRSRELWNLLLAGKWVDPMLAVVAGYALAREGRFDDAEVVVHNLREYFAGLPDTEALARLTGQPHRRPESAPLILDGLVAFDDYASLAPVPEGGSLDFRGPWTLWRTRTMTQ